MGNLGWTEIIIILVIALIIFGPRKLPQLGKSLGESLAQFRRASEDFKRTWEQEVETEKRRLEIAEPTPTAESWETTAAESPAQEPDTTTDETAAQSEQDTPLSTDEPAEQVEVAATEPRRDWV